MKFKSFALMAIAGAAALSAIAAPSKFNEKSLPEPLKAVSAGGVKVVKSFPAEGGMTGWVLSRGVNQNMIVYTPESGAVMIAGNMIDASGKNLTPDYLEKHAPKPEFTNLWKKLDSDKSLWVAEGALKDPKSVVYVFKDPNCGYCHLAWKALQPYEKVGLQIRWIPVAFLGGDSLDKAANLLGAKNADEAINQLHTKWGDKTPVAAASKELRDRVQANTKLMNEWGFTGTPAVLYKDKAGVVRGTPGMFRTSELPAMTGLPEQPQTDSALARFK